MLLTIWYKEDGYFNKRILQHMEGNQSFIGFFIRMLIT